jgi:hypothetical protein
MEIPFKMTSTLWWQALQPVPQRLTAATDSSHGKLPLDGLESNIVTTPKVLDPLEPHLQSVRLELDFLDLTSVILTLRGPAPM